MNLKLAIKVGSLAALAVVSSSAFGQELNLEGTVTGGFDGTSTTSIGGLSYLGSTFNTNTSGGFYALGGNPSTSANFNNLGSFSLSGTPSTYYGHTFTLDVTFTEPGGIINGSSNTYTAQLLGQVSSNNSGGLLVNFGTSPKIFTFSNGKQIGSFDLNVNNVSIQPTQLASVTGYGVATTKAVPEPASMFCIGSGLVGMVLKRRKKSA
jgi:hypothetical protein